jgi:N-acetyl-anhydromuramyl-L-alanine amidase AmpD
MTEIIEKIITNGMEKTHPKKQIIITHTSRRVGPLLVSYKYRSNGKYSKLPHYIITREGKIIKLLDDNQIPNNFNDINLNNNSIVISLENLGWLEKQPLKNGHINWLGDIYSGKVVERKWRDYFFWHPYTDIQLDKTAELCIDLSKTHKIPLTCIGHNTKVKGSESFNGIITKSNFDSGSTDLSPAFNFDYFVNKLNDE